MDSFTPSEKVVVLVPAYNEAAHIGAVVERARAFLPVWVVDDGSRDDTARAAEAAGARVFLQRPNQGKGSALRMGFRQALADGFDAVITLDADGQHDPVEIPKFLAAFHANRAELIIGERNFRQMPFFRRTANSIGRVMFSWAVRCPIPDNQSGYRLINRRMMQAVMSSREQGYEFEVEMIVACIARGMRLEWVPIRTIYADEVSSIQPGRHALRFLRLIWNARAATRQAKHRI